MSDIDIRESREKRILDQLSSYIKRNNLSDEVIKYLSGDNVTNTSQKKQRSPVIQYINNWTKSMNRARSTQEKIQLSKEMIDFMADRAGDPELSDEVKSGIVRVIKKNLGGEIKNKNYQAMIRSIRSGTRLESKKYNVLDYILKESDISLSDLGFKAYRSKTTGKVLIKESVQ